MRKSNLLASLLLAAPLAGLAAESPVDAIKAGLTPYEACKDVAMISQTDFKKNKDFWDQAINECGVEVQVVNDTGFFAAIVNKLAEDGGATRSYDFLTKVGKKALQYVDGNNRMTEVLLHCAKKDEKWFQTQAAKLPGKTELYDYGNCDDLLSDVRDVVEENSREFYIERGLILKNGGTLAKGTAKLSKLFGLSEVTAQPTAEEAAEIEKISLDERGAAGRAHKEAFEKMKFATEKPRAGDMALNAKKAEFATKHLANYQAALQKAPIMAYLQKRDLSDADIAQAAEKVLANGVKERNKIVSTIASSKETHYTFTDELGNSHQIEAKMTDKQRADSLLSFMAYRPAVEAVLNENRGGHCNTANDLVNYMANYEGKKQAAMLGTMLVGGIGGAAIKGVAATGAAVYGAIGSSVIGASMVVPVGLMYKDTADKYRGTRNAALSVVHTDETKKGAGKAVGATKDYLEARDSLTYGLALAPLDIAGFGIYKGAANMGAKFFAKAIADGKLMKALRSKGMSEFEAGSLIKQLQSKDPAVSAKAGNRLLAELDIPREDVGLVRDMASKGLISETDPAAMAKLEEIMAKVPRNDRAVMMERARQVLKEVNSAKINNGNRAEVLDVMLNGSLFGVKDPKHLAGVINDWDEGLDGLARTYEIAAKKMSDPKIRGLASVEARQKAAFGSALDDLRASNKSLKEMPEKQWAEMKENMMACPLKPAK